MSKKHTLRTHGTDVERLRNMKDEDIDFSDIPKTTPEMWEKGFVRKPLISKNPAEDSPIDRDIIEYIKTQGRGYQEKINQLLRDYIASHQAE